MSVSVSPDIVKDSPEIRNLSKIFLRCFKNVGPGYLQPPPIKLLFTFLLVTNERIRMYCVQNFIMIFLHM